MSENAMTVRAAVHVPDDGLRFGITVPADVAARYRDRGWWRDTSVLHDLLRVASERPDDPAIVAHRAEEGRMTVVRYGELVSYVRRFTAALAALGVRRGDRVAFQLPNSWEAAALTLACCWRGVIAVPLEPSLRAREVERVLGAARAQVCVVRDFWDGYDCAEALGEISARLPWLRHCVVYGDRVPAGAVDFAEFFLHTPHEGRAVLPPLPSGPDLDRVCLMQFTTDLTGERRVVLHTENTLYAGCGGPASETERGWAAREVFSTPHPIASSAGMRYCVWGPLLAGGTGVYQDVWSPGSYLRLLSEASVTQAFMTPEFVRQLVTEQRRRPRSLPLLRFVMCDALSGYVDLVRDIKSSLVLGVRSCWGMGEFGMGFRNREDAPCGWAAVSDGQPMPGMEMDLRPAPGDEELSRLWVRGAQLCVGYGRVGADEPIHPTWSHNGGWLDTGALVWDDGRGGIRLAHGASRLMGTSVTVPAAEIEEEILRHPGVREVAVVGHMDDQGRQLTSAVIVPSGDRCPALAELIGILTERGMTPWYLPTRLRKVKGALPRTPGGGIDYDRIRALMSAG